LEFWLRRKFIQYAAMKKQEFRDKVVVITGASAGIGRATAWEFAKQGAKLAFLARGMEQ